MICCSSMLLLHSRPCFKFKPSLINSPSFRIELKPNPPNFKFKRQSRCRAVFSDDAPFTAAIGACMLTSLVFPVSVPAEDEEGAVTSTDSRLAVMGIISFIPYFNWLSWVFAWLDTGKRRYAVYSLVYLAPYLRLSGCTLIDMYVKCGEMKKALLVFSKLEKKCVYTWTAVIGGYAVHGKGREALDWFIQMQKAGIKPTPITFTAILTAISHAGLIEEGKSLFESMSTVYNVNPAMEHYGCMVDLLGRAGLLKEAKEFIESMPVKPNAAIWGALLNACNLHKHLELGKEVGKILIELDPDHGGRYIHLASIHAAAGEWNQAVQVRSQIKDRGLLNPSGCSSITLNGVVHEFFAGAGPHPHIQEINDMPDLIANR